MSAEVNEILSAVAGNSRGGVRRVRIYAHGHFPAHTHTHTPDASKWPCGQIGSMPDQPWA